MDFELNETQRMYRDMVRAFVARELRPVALQYDRKADPHEAVPADVYRKGLEQGFHQMVVPAEFGGMGLDAVSTIVILEEMAAGDAGFATTRHVNDISLTVLVNMGSEEEIVQVGANAAASALPPWARTASCESGCAKPCAPWPERPKTSAAARTGSGAKAWPS